MKLPELLCPAGSMEALAAAVDGGADAVYFGGTHFNARMFANNFDSAAMREAVSLCHTYGVKAYVTLNTLPLDRYISEKAASNGRVVVAPGAYSCTDRISINPQIVPLRSLHVRRGLLC